MAVFKKNDLAYECCHKHPRSKVFYNSKCCKILNFYSHYFMKNYFTKFFQVETVDSKEHGHSDALGNKCIFSALQKDHTNLGTTSTG